jgi:ubiquitin C-terminal hydrolase
MENLILPSNYRNSCYLNSLLVALFLEPNLFITSRFLEATIPLAQRPTQYVYGHTPEVDLQQRKEIQKTLTVIVNCLRQGSGEAMNSINKLRTLLGECRFGSNFDDGKQHDVTDFLSALCEVFYVHDNVNQQHMQVFGSHDLINTPPKTAMLTTDTVNYTGIMHHVFNWTAGDLISYTLENVMDNITSQFSEQQFNRSLTVTKFQSHCYFAFHIDRTVTGSVNRTPLLVEHSICIGNTKFNLLSIVLHFGDLDGGHYVSVILRKDGKVYLYDDLNTYLTVSTLTIEEISRYSVLVFYGI